MAGTNQTDNVFSNAGTLSERMVADVSSDKVVGASAPDVSSSLWEAAYENPGKTALVVGGTALIVGAAIASRGKLAKILPSAKNEVLLVEDSPYFGAAIKETLETQGSKVTWLAGADDAKAFKAGIGLGPDGKSVTVPLDRFKTAFVDGDLAGKITGAEVVEGLTAKHITSVGISSQPTMNAEMLKQGAVAAGLKPSVFGALVNKDVTVAGVIKNPGAVQGQIDSYQARYLKDHSIAKRASEILTRWIERTST